MNIAQVTREFLEELAQIIQTKSVVGEPIQAGDALVIPVSKVSFGFGLGGGEHSGDKKEPSEGSLLGAGANIEPVAFIIISEGKAQLLTLKGKEGLSLGKVVDLIPEVISQLKGLRKKEAPEKEEGEPAGEE